MLQTLNRVTLVVMMFAVTVSHVYGQHHDHRDPPAGHSAVSDHLDHGGHSDHDDHDDHDEHHSEHTEINPQMAQQVGITTAIARGGAINRSLSTYGTLRTPPGQISHLKARFEGLIEEVNAQIGQQVTAGDVLARVQSNESLNSYEVQAPLSGVIIARHASVGEVAGDQVLFSIGNFDTLWAELKVFPLQRSQIRQGQEVLIKAGGAEATGHVAHILPSAEDEPFVIARVEIANEHNQWAPGLAVKGDIAVQTQEVPIRVENRALQVIDSSPVVFVQNGNSYHARPVVLGAGDDHHTAIEAGLEPGESYVVNNSYLIKADIEKSGAAHHH